IFSRRGGLKYTDFEKYLTKLYLQSKLNALVLDYKDLKWSVIDEEEVRVLDHAERAGLQLADVVASAFFQAVELNRGGAQLECDPSHAKLLKPIIHHKGFSWYLGVGLKPMPSLHAMDLVDSQRALFTYYGAKEKD